MARFLAQHGAHAGEIFVPILWMGTVILRARRRPAPAPPARPGRLPVLPVLPVLPWVIVVAATAGSALVHASVIRQHYGEGLIYGLFFTGLAAGQLTLAVIIAWKRDLRVVAFTAAGAAATIVLWLLTRLVGIPAGPESGQTEAFAALDIVASSLESATILASLYLLHRAAGSRRGRAAGSRRGRVATV